MPNARGLLPLLLVVAALGGCKENRPWWGATRPEGLRGRYTGVGIYTPGAGWTRQAAGQSHSTDAAARLSDDEAVIVVVDSQTGEIRGCGDLSGYCVGMNPWRRALAKPQQAPVDLVAPAKQGDKSASNDAGNTAAANR